LAILGLIRASQFLGNPDYLTRAQLSADYLVRIQDTDGAWYNQYSFDLPHDDIAKSPLSTAEVMIAFHRLGFATANAARKTAMTRGAEFLLQCQKRANKTGIDDGLIGAGKAANGAFEKWRWASDNSFGYLALKAAEDRAMQENDLLQAERYSAAAAKILEGIDKIFYINDPMNPDYKVWNYAVNENDVPQTAKGRIWVNYAPQMLDIPALGVGDPAVGNWIHAHLQKSDGAVTWADIDNDEHSGGGNESQMKSPGFSFQASLAWIGLGQTAYRDSAVSWAEESGLWQHPVTCNGTLGGWVDWIDDQPPTPPGLEAAAC
jgi:hypothetical protein